MEHLLYVGIVQAVFSAAFVLTKRKVTLNDKVFATWMVFIALPMLAGALASSLPGARVLLLGTELVYPLTYGAFLWLYVGTLTGDVSKLRARHLVHFLPFVAMSLVQVATDWVPPPPNPVEPEFTPATRVVGAMNLALMLAYTVVVFRRLRLHGEEVLEHFSELSNRVTLGWLRWLIAGISAAYLLFFLASALSLPGLLSVLLPAQVALILALSFFGLRQTRVFDRHAAASPEAPSEDPTVVEPPEPALPEPTDEPGDPARDLDPDRDCNPDRDPGKPRYSRSGLTEERAEVIATRLDSFMKAQRPYLDAELTIEKLAKRMAVPRHHLTQVISERHGMTFYLFVNGYRIAAVKQALEDPANAKGTLLDMAYAFGFNSKSTFNTAFKRLVGVTPSQYRARIG